MRWSEFWRDKKHLGTLFKTHWSNTSASAMSSYFFSLSFSLLHSLKSYLLFFHYLSLSYSFYSYLCYFSSLFHILLIPISFLHFSRRSFCMFFFCLVFGFHSSRPKSVFGGVCVLVEDWRLFGTYKFIVILWALFKDGHWLYVARKRNNNFV